MIPGESFGLMTVNITQRPNAIQSFVNSTVMAIYDKLKTPQNHSYETRLDH